MHISATALATLSQAVERVDQAAEGVQRATQPAAEIEDQIDLSQEAVILLVAKNGYDAAVKLAKTADEINNQAIDLLA